MRYLFSLFTIGLCFVSIQAFATKEEVILAKENRTVLISARDFEKPENRERVLYTLGHEILLGSNIRIIPHEAAGGCEPVAELEPDEKVEFRCFFVGVFHGGAMGGVSSESVSPAFRLERKGPSITATLISMTHLGFPVQGPLRSFIGLLDIAPTAQNAYEAASPIGFPCYNPAEVENSLAIKPYSTPTLLNRAAKFAEARSLYACETWSGVECSRVSLSPSEVVEPVSNRKYCFFRASAAPIRKTEEAHRLRRLNRCVRSLYRFERADDKPAWAGVIDKDLEWRVVTEEVHYCLTAERLETMGDCLPLRTLEGYLSDDNFFNLPGARVCANKALEETPHGSKERFLQEAKAHAAEQLAPEGFFARLRLPTPEEIQQYFGGDDQTFRVLVPSR